MENHAHAMALHFLYYNFVRIHKTLGEVADMVDVPGVENHQTDLRKLLIVTFRAGTLGQLMYIRHIA